MHYTRAQTNTINQIVCVYKMPAIMHEKNNKIEKER